MKLDILVFNQEGVEPEQEPEKRFSAIINVSDSPCSTFEHKCPSFWFPIQEMGKWGHSPFYGAAKVVDRFSDNPLPVAIHCHGGVNRSMCVALALQLAEGLDPREFNIEGHRTIPATDCMGSFERNIKKGCIPDNIVEFLAERKQYPTYSILGLLQELGTNKNKQHIYADYNPLKSSPDSEL